MTHAYLMHRGILGMKWGVRRYQNKDGSRTALGKQHRRELEGYSDLSDQELRSKVDRLQREKRYADAKSRQRPTHISGQTLDTVGKATNKTMGSIRDRWKNNAANTLTKVPTSAMNVVTSLTNTERYINEANAARRKKDAYSEVERLSDAELNRRLSRIELENRYLDLSTEKADTKRGKGAVRRIVGGTASAIGTLGGAIIAGKAIVDSGKFLYKVIKK